MEGLQNLVNLRELYLSHNGIEVIEGLENNVSYRNFWKRLDTKWFSCANVLTIVCSGRANIWFVFLSQKKLTTLDIAANRVKKIENISHLTELQEFWVRIFFWPRTRYHNILGFFVLFFWNWWVEVELLLKQFNVINRWVCKKPFFFYGR